MLPSIHKQMTQYDPVPTISPTTLSHIFNCFPFERGSWFPSDKNITMDLKRHELLPSINHID